MSTTRTERLPHRPPSDCPVCGDELSITRLGCGSCGTELAGLFRSCEFCALNEAETEMLRVFLGSRGNLREVEKHLGVSYPTARARFAALLDKLGLGDEPEPTAVLTRDQILAEVASGALSPAEAQALIAGLCAPSDESSAIGRSRPDSGSIRPVVSEVRAQLR